MFLWLNFFKGIKTSNKGYFSLNNRTLFQIRDYVSLLTDAKSILEQRRAIKWVATLSDVVKSAETFICKLKEQFNK